MEKQELVGVVSLFIGAGLDRAAITAALDAALLPTEFFLPEAWVDLADPAPAWDHRRAG